MVGEKVEKKWEKVVNLFHFTPFSKEVGI